MKIERRYVLKAGLITGAGMAMGCGAHEPTSPGTGSAAPVVADLPGMPALVMAVGGALITDARADGVMCIFPPPAAAIEHKPVAMVPSAWGGGAIPLGKRLICTNGGYAFIDVSNATVWVNNSKPGSPRIFDAPARQKKEPYSELDRLSLDWLLPIRDLHPRARLRPDAMNAPWGAVVMDAGFVFSWWNKYTSQESWTLSGTHPLANAALSDWTLNAVERHGDAPLEVKLTENGKTITLGTVAAGDTTYVAVVNWPASGAVTTHGGHLPLLYDIIRADESPYTMSHASQPRQTETLTTPLIKKIHQFVTDTVYSAFNAADDACRTGVRSNESSGCPNGFRRG